MERGTGREGVADGCSSNSISMAEVPTVYQMAEAPSMLRDEAGIIRCIITKNKIMDFYFDVALK